MTTKEKEKERNDKLEAVADKALDLLVGIVEGTVLIAIDKTTTGWFVTFARKPT